ncbi:MATE family efflux transporter [Bacteroides sp. GM023]|uniref:MATE family efflux transporter n=1 Tax=Bacteroides sp. GM023 TaxID=2723058 RepID=UPI00168AD7C1|nr:MATE family efflux transporter [Bacteroides sp. GM023]MBD3592534.1 MATE family efflux transporter [Bacteroides sp. GM023]
MKDSIDFGSMEISTLFRKLLIPTVLGMIFSAIFVITDGIFVGKGIGSDALAAVNITAPLFMITAGIGLMFGVGASVVASIHLSQGKRKVASINVTQALMFSTLLILIMSALCFYYIEPLAKLLGSSDRLLPLAVEYMAWYLPFLVFYEILNIGMFCIRLDGSPTYAMMCNAVAAILNIILDYIFIFEFGWGMMGAAFATSLGTVVGGLMTLVYLLKFSRSLHLCRIKLSIKSMMLTLRNVGYMIKLGSSAFISEASIACMMFLGNYVFIHYLGEDGVAAFSIACYFFPIIFMVYNAIAQSAQPIISYNFGAGQPDRVRKTLHLAIRTALICGISFFIITVLCRQNIVSLFIDRSYEAFDIAVNGIPYFGVGFIFFAFNMVGIGYYQSVERGQRATIITLLRGVVFMLIGFLVLPKILGIPGIWLAVPFAELLTMLYIIGIYFKDRFVVRRR